jgi:predicted RNA-binding Zn ribbon-like protein
MGQPRAARVGGRLSLDFLNTVHPRHGPGRHDWLPDYAALLDWAADGSVAVPSGVPALRRMAGSEPTAAALAHAQVQAFRESLYRVFAASLRGLPVTTAGLASVNAVLRDATDHHVLVAGRGGGVRDGWSPSDDLAQVLWPIAIDAWDVLTEAALDRVRECPGGGGCGRLFLDTSRSGTRRWCDMRTCGNRAKARAHYARG